MNSENVKKTLIIIGNGFDRAHNLQTSYGEFIENLFKNYFNDKNVYKGVLDVFSSSIDSFQALCDIIDEKTGRWLGSKGSKPFHHYNLSAVTQEHGGLRKCSEYEFFNKFMELLIAYKTTEYKWCDIESEYFKELMLYCGENNYNPINLNNDLNQVKKYLSDYLIMEEKKGFPINGYNEFFKLFADSDNSLILNFNYTRTIKNLYKDVIKCPVIHIHGELESEENPIIFGYAADREELSNLRSQHDNEYLKNIKQILYKRTNNKNKLDEFLKKSKLPTTSYDSIKDNNDVGIFILGHSCGLSDKLILNDIFNCEFISFIKNFYYETYENFFDVQVNIDRIMNNDERTDKLIINFQESHRMPQWNDKETQIKNFIKYIESIR